MPASERLAARRNPDGGFGPVPGAGSEPEPTALAALALDDPDAAAWLEDAQGDDGSVGVRAGAVFRDLTARGRARDARSGCAAGGDRLGSSRTLRAPSPPPRRSRTTPRCTGGPGPATRSDGPSRPRGRCSRLRLTGQDGPELDDGVVDAPRPGMRRRRLELRQPDRPRRGASSVRPDDRRSRCWRSAASRTSRWSRPRPRPASTPCGREERDGVLSLALSTAAAPCLRRPGAQPTPRRVLERTLAATADADTIALAWAAIARRRRAGSAGGDVMHHASRMPSMVPSTGAPSSAGAVAAGVAVGAVGVGLGRPPRARARAVGRGRVPAARRRPGRGPRRAVLRRRPRRSCSRRGCARSAPTSAARRCC